MLTKPAAAFAQFIGFFLAFGFFGDSATATVVGIAGVALFIWGGFCTRRRIALDQLIPGGENHD